LSIEATIFSPGRVRQGGHQVYKWKAGHLQGESRQPLLDACRALLEDGTDPKGRAEMVWRRTGPDHESRDEHEPGDGCRSLSCPVGVGAKLSVGEEPLARFRPMRDVDQYSKEGDGPSLVPGESLEEEPVEE
jgi:hypothetical protein